MSTFYASYDDAASARTALEDLLRGGVRPEDLSLLMPNEGPISEMGSVGDASFYVGGEDDPEQPLFGDDLMAERTMAEASSINGIDTSDSAYTGDTIDQMDDSQALAEESLYPLHGISNSTHQADEMALSVTTGFPTAVPDIEDVIDSTSELEDQNESEVEMFSVDGFGQILGNGPLATAALGDGEPYGRVVEFLIDEGASKQRASELAQAIESGRPLLSVVITPGELDENAVETIALQHGGTDEGLIDAPRYYDHGATLR